MIEQERLWIEREVTIREVVCRETVDGQIRENVNTMTFGEEERDMDVSIYLHLPTRSGFRPGDRIKVIVERLEEAK